MKSNLTSIIINLGHGEWICRFCYAEDPGCQSFLCFYVFDGLQSKTSPAMMLTAYLFISFHIVPLKGKNMIFIIRGLKSCTQVMDSRWRQCNFNDMLEIFMAHL